jgi:3-oxoacyl-[acyl-carrier protein] reductase
VTTDAGAASTVPHREPATVDQTVIVTGAGGGIGSHIARHLVGSGARVLAADLDRDGLDRLAGSLNEAPGAIATVATDVRQPDDVGRMVATAVETFGPVDTLVNNAGVSVHGGVRQLASSDLETMLATNVVGPFHCIRATLPQFRSGSGSIINVGSVLVSRPRPDRSGYIASKGALEAMSRALAGELGPIGVRVNVVRPGLVPSGLRGRSPAQEEAIIAAQAPRIQALARVGRGQDIAAVVAFLASDAAAWITGAVIDVDGGYLVNPG